jgi:hypothetical protein
VGYIFLILTWFLAGAVWGGIGVAVGPGILMLIVVAIVASCGCLYSLSERLFGYQLELALAGLSIFSASLMVTIFVVPSLTFTGSGYIYMAVFVLIPSYLILFAVRKLATKF